jgi:outer membrane protein OmpA-like peptidoglycan-associated protein
MNSSLPHQKGRLMSRTRLLTLILTLALTRVAVAQQMPPDADGCKDVFVSRLAGYYINRCDQKDFDAHHFMAQTDNETVVEGKWVQLYYAQPDGANPNSPLKVERNYENALQASGWTILAKSDSELTAKQIKNGKERWVELSYNNGDGYEIDVAEKAGMQQSVVTAEDMATALNRNGSISLHINFDTGKSTIRPDSLPIIDQIVATMKGNGSLNLSVEGYTDNVGTPQSNQTLSLARAKSVVSAVSAGGITASRMTAVGHGEDNPVADNSTEDGRALNRRVVLVKK